jgi:hypothetical protein
MKGIGSFAWQLKLFNKSYLGRNCPQALYRMQAVFGIHKNNHNFLSNIKK